MDRDNLAEEIDFEEIKEYLKNEFGIILPKGRMFANENKVFLYTGAEIDLEGRFGIYLGAMNKGIFRPSTYAAQLATKGIGDIDEKQAKNWMCGLDINVEAKGYYAIVRYKKYLLGVGKPKEGKIINNLPKNRRLPLSSL
jgi:NOL1/NOP2/fmu family ribosome biogenesis protein